MTTIAQTPRLELRELVESDAAFIHAVLNDPDFLSNVGDRGVRSLDDAVAYITSGPRASYAAHGFGLWAVVVRASGEVAGICGLLKRDVLDAPDVGYALLPAHRGRGYAFEAARASIAYGRTACGVTRVLAIVKDGNAVSVRVLEKLGLVREGTVRTSASGPELLLFSTAADEETSAATS